MALPKAPRIREEISMISVLSADASGTLIFIAERDRRVIKVKTRVSGCFRTYEGAEEYPAIMFYTGTARKQRKNAYEAETLNLSSGNQNSYEKSLYSFFLRSAGNFRKNIRIALCFSRRGFIIDIWKRGTAEKNVQIKKYGLS